jgi:hypothetical protein
LEKRGASSRAIYPSLNWTFSRSSIASSYWLRWINKRFPQVIQKESAGGIPGFFNVILEGLGVRLTISNGLPYFRFAVSRLLAHLSPLNEIQNYLKG